MDRAWCTVHYIPITTLSKRPQRQERADDNSLAGDFMQHESE